MGLWGSDQPSRSDIRCRLFVPGGAHAWRAVTRKAAGDVTSAAATVTCDSLEQIGATLG